MSPQIVHPCELHGASCAFEFQSRCPVTLKMPRQTRWAGELLAASGAGETTHLVKVRHKFVLSEVSQKLELSRANVTTESPPTLDVHGHVLLVVLAVCKWLAATCALERCFFQNTWVAFSPVFAQCLHSGGSCLANVALQSFLGLAPFLACSFAATMQCMTYSAQPFKLHYSTPQALVAISSRPPGMHLSPDQVRFNCQHSAMILLQSVLPRNFWFLSARPHWRPLLRPRCGWGGDRWRLTWGGVARGGRKASSGYMWCRRLVKGEGWERTRIRWRRGRGGSCSGQHLRKEWERELIRWCGKCWWRTRRGARWSLIDHLWNWAKTSRWFFFWSIIRCIKVPDQQSVM